MLLSVDYVALENVLVIICSVLILILALYGVSYGVLMLSRIIKKKTRGKHDEKIQSDPFR